MYRLIALVTLLGVVGCSGTTPYRDDYARHVSHGITSPFNTESFRVVIAEGEQVDLRATYDNDNTVGDSSVLYQGGPGAAGLIAMVAQIGVHSSLVSSQREEKLAAIQDAANQQIQPLLDIASTMTVAELIPASQSGWLATADTVAPLHIKPIFFSAQDMSEFGLKMVVWIPDPKGTKKRPDKYKNLLQVIGEPVDEATLAQLKSGNKQVLEQQLTGLLSIALEMAHKATTGQYPQNTSTMQTYKLEKNGKLKVFRAAEVASTCQYTVVRDLRKWLIAMPKSQPASKTENATATQNPPAPLADSCYTRV